MIRSRGIGRNVEGESMRVAERVVAICVVLLGNTIIGNLTPSLGLLIHMQLSEKMRGVDYNCENSSQRKELVSTKGLVIVFCT